MNGHLSKLAWNARFHARLLAPNSTAVGCAVRTNDGRFHAGANIQHPFRNHLHAEVVALSQAVTVGSNRVTDVLVAAERENFTPCGSCMDWIMELGGPGARVHVQNRPDGKVRTFLAEQLMPYYPS